MQVDSSNNDIYKNIDSVSDFINSVLHISCTRGASDIHIDPSYTDVSIRFRVDGSLLIDGVYDKIFHEEVIGRIKILSKLRTDIHDKSQDGRFFFENRIDREVIKIDKGEVHVNSKENIDTNNVDIERVDVRVSVLPTFYGENIVLRLLRPDLRRGQRLKDLGLSEEQAQVIEKHIVREQGMIIIAGPTGSGKTTTIYSIISSLLSHEKNIVTIEDPIEYVIAGVRQIQVSEQSDFGFAKALRAILRQDPDIIVLGEIRDSETAHLAFQASLTGHLVITTIHAEDSAGVYGRLHDLGITREMMHSLSLFISQRLIKVKYKKRVGVFEVIPVEGKTKVTLFQNTFPEYIRAALKKQGVLLLEDSIQNVHSYNYSLEEKVNPEST